MSGTVIEHKVWVGPSGRTFSQFTSWKEPGAVLETRGFTIRWPDGTTGLGRPAFATREEAQAVADRVVNFPGMSQG